MGFGVLIYAETLLSLSGNKNWTENVQPALPLDESCEVLQWDQSG